jgi:hypothetical protein
MAMAKKFYLPWAHIDPDLKHGGISGELEGNYVGPDLGDNTTTKNRDLLLIFSCVRDVAAALSMMPGADVEGPPLRNHVNETLQAMNWIMERTMDRTAVCSSDFFMWTHAIPPVEHFKLRPIKYPLRMAFMDDVVFHLIGLHVEFAEMNANGFHSSLDPSSTARLLAPLYHLKAKIALDWFDKEVEGQVSVEELSDLFQNIKPPGPNIVPSGESHPTPTPEAVAQALQGISLIQWFPTKEDWQVFGKKRTMLYKAERIWQPEGAISATEDVAPENPTQPVTPG